MTLNTSEDFSNILSQNAENRAISLLINYGDTNNVGDFLDFDGSMISWMPYDKCKLYGDNYKSYGRQSAKFGKAIRSFLPKPEAVSGSIRRSLDAVDDTVIEDAVNRCKATYALFANPESLFSILTGDDIIYAYDADNYAPNCGDLNNSCMRYERALTYLDLYRDNAQLLVIKNAAGKIEGRALLWEGATVDGQPITYLDRQYASAVHMQLYRKYAQKMGWYYFDYYGSVSLNGQRLSPVPKIQFELKQSEYDKYPYMDTMAYIDGNTLYNYRPFDYCDMIQSTSGTRSINGAICVECNTRHRLGNMHTHDNQRYCNSCYINLYNVRCVRCNDWMDRNDARTLGIFTPLCYYCNESVRDYEDWRERVVRNMPTVQLP